MFGVAPSLLVPRRETSTRPVVTWNPADKDAGVILSNGNLTATRSGADSLKSVRATYGIPHTESGYFEVYFAIGNPGSWFQLVGVATSSASLASFVGNDANGWGYYQDTGGKYTNNVLTAYGNDWKGGFHIGIAFKNGSVWFARNNTWQNSGDPVAGTGAAFTGITGTIYPMLSLYKGSVPQNFMDGRFKFADFLYTPPTGFDPWGT